jgi:anti-anti-sigma factor
MSALKRSNDGVTEIILEGRIVHPHNEDMIALTESFLRSKDHTLVVNFKSVNFIDSAELGTLLLMRMRITECNKTLILAQPSDFVLKLFNSYQFEKVFTIER